MDFGSAFKDSEHLTIPGKITGLGNSSPVGIGNFPDSILIEDYDEKTEGSFLRDVVKPYFGNIFDDISMRSLSPKKGAKKSDVFIDNVAFFEYTKLPGIICDRFFSTFRRADDGFIYKDAFVEGFVRVYLSTTDTKMRMTFDMYDFNNDGRISKEDVRILLSYVPFKSGMGPQETTELKVEGQYQNTENNYESRKHDQKEINWFLDQVFGKKQTLTFQDYLEINQNQTSEMFISLMRVLHGQLPCTRNFFHMKRNFKNKTGGSPASGGKVNKIATPKMVSGLQMGGGGFSSAMSPSNRNKNAGEGCVSPKKLNVRSKMGRQQATDKRVSAIKTETDGSHSPITPSKAYGARTGPSGGTGFKISLQGTEEAKDQNPNNQRRVSSFGTAFDASGVKLPTSFGAANEEYDDEDSSPDADAPTTVIDGFGDSNQNEDCVTHEGPCFLKTKTENYKKHWMVIIGNELYFYKRKGDTQHKVMHCLSGTYLKEVTDEVFDQNGERFYPLKIVIPPNKSRLTFFSTLQEQQEWTTKLMEAMGYSNVFQYYELDKTLGKGQFGLVKLARHKKTRQKVAVKQVKKKNMSHIEVFQQRREIEVLKMCQHPNIISLVDIFENSEYYYIVLDYMEGSDLFDYLQARDFNLGEERVRVITYQLALGIKYLHSYGIVHRDMKLENIMMTDTTEKSVPKLVDFGLAKMIGPNEKADEPFGTLGYVAPEILEKKPYSFQCDLWSLGCIVYALMCSSLPFDHDSQKETIRMTCEDQVIFDSPQWKNCSAESMDMIFKLLIKNPEKRLTLDQLFKHPWMQKIDKKTMVELEAQWKKLEDNRVQGTTRVRGS